MIIALFALAVLMIVGGVASVVQGFPFVRLESGMAMTVAGATTASAGAVVLGLATVASHLRGLARRWGEMRRETAPAEDRPVEAAPPRRAEPDPSQPVFAEPAFSLPLPGDRTARQRPSLGVPDALAVGQAPLGAATGLGTAGLGTAGLGTAGLGTAGLGTAGLATAEFAKDPFGGDGAAFGAGPRGRGSEPTFVLPPEVDPPAPPRHEVEPLLPDLLPEADAAVPVAAAPVAPEPAAADTVVPEDDRTLALFDTAPDAPPEPVRLHPTLDAPTDIGTEAAPPPPVEDRPEVVGTYTSGGNTYVMFANGSIEAETPRGRFSFGSLDELKDFVEAGGESDARGAA